MASQAVDASSTDAAGAPVPASARNVVIVPGNGTGCASSNFYQWLAKELRAKGFTVSLKEMPDPNTARERIWLPFMRSELGTGPHTLLVGHSSGACAALRLAETDPLFAVVAVSFTHSDLGDANEKASGYYSRPWEWGRMRANTQHIVQFSSTDDPFIPIEVQREARDGLEAGGAAGSGTFEYIELDKKSHFFDRKQTEILTVCESLLKK